MIVFKKVGLTDIKEDDSEDTPCDIRKKTSFKHFKKGSKKVDTISVTSVITSQSTNQFKSSRRRSPCRCKIFK